MSAADGQPAFASILCGLDASQSSREAGRQAVLLAGAGTELTLLAVVADEPTHLEEGPLVDPELGRRAVEAAADLARARDVEVRTRIVEGGNPGRLIVDASAGHDLVVVGSHGRSRGAGVIIGSVASAALHTAAAPVLVARSPQHGGDFPGDVLVASDGSHDAARGVRLACAIARAHGTRVTFVHVDDGGEARRHELSVQTVAATEAIGVEPAVVEAVGDAREHIVRVARAQEASLLVMGSRGLGGVRALGSVSERVAHEAPCSVLVAREPGAG